jgi:hypothetical protein
MASGGKEASSLASASIVARSYDVAGTASIGAFANSDAIEQFLQVNSRQVNQMTTGTARVTTHIVARTATGNFFARRAISITTAQAGETDTFERIQTAKRKLRGAANFIARAASKCSFVARTTTSNFVARGADGRGEQASQFPAQFCAGNIATDFVARIASGGFVARIASQDGIARIAVAIQANSVH